MDFQLLFKIFKRIVIVSCILATIHLSLNVLLEYIKDQDNSTVSFRDFHERDDYFYPSVSLCFKAGIYKIKSGDYKDFLSGCQFNKGCIWNSSYARQDYDSATINLMDYVVGEITLFEDNSNHTYIYDDSNKTEIVTKGQKENTEKKEAKGTSDRKKETKVIMN